MQSDEIQLFAFVPTFCVLVKTEVVPIKIKINFHLFPISRLVIYDNWFYKLYVLL